MWDYLDRRYPDAAACDLSVIPLGEGWLVQVEGTVKSRLLFMVNRHGFVEEMGRARVTAKTAGSGSSVISRTPLDIGPIEIDLTQTVQL